MTTDTIGAGRLARSGELRVIGLVSSAHFVSHFHSMVLPPLFLFLRSDGVWGLSSSASR